MIDECFKIGDEVVITIPQDSRMWGYNPCPDGTHAMIIDFCESDYGRVHTLGREPGIYRNFCWARLRMPDGSEHTEYSGRFELTDIEETKRREAEWIEWRKATGEFMKAERLRDLPETPFWEGDRVKVSRRSVATSVYAKMPPDNDPEVFTVTTIHYLKLMDKTDFGTPYPAYDISEGFGAGWNKSAAEPDMTLVERGNVWKHYHHEPLSFKDNREEGEFYDLIGRTVEVRNPTSGDYHWEKDEVLAAIANGTVHAFSMPGNPLTGTRSIRAIRYLDEEVGKKMAAETLKGFGIVPVTVN